MLTLLMPNFHFHLNPEIPHFARQMSSRQACLGDRSVLPPAETQPPCKARPGAVFNESIFSLSLQVVATLRDIESALRAETKFLSSDPHGPWWHKSDERLIS